MRTTSLRFIMETLFEKYNNSIKSELRTAFSIKNIMAVPKLMKIVINCGIGEAVSDKKVIDSMSTQLSIIGGQKPMVCKSKKAISSFKTRIGDPIGLKITLRGPKMFDFYTKLVNVALPRVRDFRGVPLNGFDGNGNYTFGIKEQNIFPELEYKLIDKTRGFEITIVTNAMDDKKARKLLELLGMPFEKREA
jgi:large subunit ribosomal protein L5